MLEGIIRPPVLSLGNEKIITRHVAATALSLFFRTYPKKFRDEERRSRSKIEQLFRNLEHPSGVADFSGFLRHRKAQLEESLREIVPPEMANEVGLNNGEWIENIVGPDSRFSLAEAEVSSDYRTVRDLRKTSFDKGDDKTVGWAGARAKTIAEEDVLSFLSRKAVIPKYGFPVDVVELDAHRTRRSFESTQVSLQRDLSIAIAEFAPTSKLVANKKVWTSYGLKKVAEKEWERKCYMRCSQHNLFRSWDTEEERPSQKTCHEELPLQKCCNRAVVGVYVIPRFGFVTDRSKPKEPKRRPARVFTTRPYFVRWKGVEPSDIDLGVIRLTKASPGWMVVLCEGRRGEGFYICGKCGAGFRGHKSKHKTPYGEHCSGRPEQVSLGHEFVTDVLRLQFCLEPPRRDMEPVWFAYSLAYALVEGAAGFLGVPSIDLSVTVAYSSGETIPPIVLYDNVPGGAGLVARLEDREVLRACLEAAQERVNGGCGCDDNTSCYGCLRSYRNQFAHQHLRRRPVMRYLEAVLAEW
jgi:glutaredoxin-related protein